MRKTSVDTHEKALPQWQRFQQTVVWEYLQVIVVAFVLVFGFIRPFVVEAFEIPSGSMEETLLVGDRILVCKFIYGINIPGTKIKLFELHKPARGDVFVFVPPHERTKHFIKRIVAVGGDTIETKGDTLYVNGVAIEDGAYTKHTSHALDHKYDFPPFRLPHHLPDDNALLPYKLSPNQFHITFPDGKPFEVPEGDVFAMGDNRDQSSDSRTWGTVSVNDIKGQAFMVFWSYDLLNQRRPWEIWKIIDGIRFSRIGHLIRSEFDGRH